MVLKPASRAVSERQITKWRIYFSRDLTRDVVEGAYENAPPRPPSDAAAIKARLRAMRRRPEEALKHNIGERLVKHNF